jgi:hypothetical protein
MINRRIGWVMIIAKKDKTHITNHINNGWSIIRIFNL